MRILVAHSYYQQAGGEDRVFEAEADLLERHGHEVLRYRLENANLKDLSRTDMLRVSHWNPQSFEELSGLIKDFKPEVAHFHNTFPLMSPSVYAACQQANVPVVQTLHNYRLACPAATLFREGKVCEHCLQRRIKWPAIQHGCYRESRQASAVVASMLAFHWMKGTWQTQVDLYIAISDFVRGKMIEAGLPSDKVVTKANAVSASPPGKGGSKALFVGRLVPEKGIESLLSAWRVLGKTLALEIVGEGPLSNLVQEAERRYEGIHYLGQLAKNEVEALMQSAAFVVFPSVWNEPFGLVIAEAFAAGTPVVAAKTDSVVSMIEEGLSGHFFEAGQADSLIHEVHKLVAAPEHLHMMRSRARAAFEAKYSEAASYARLLDIYERVCGTHRT